ncbi:procathepsin L-like [Hyperolius riggenbachi]|uniref:procathepsin L-like n=1 Tax=Hyperolius riggenbachi TaxID=752182 RepID=UPI0035A298C5
MHLDKYLLVLSAIFLCVSCSLLLDQEWKAWKSKHEKTYATPYQEEFRRKAWEQTWHKVQKHNQKYEEGLTKYTMAVNTFADLTQEERDSKSCLSGKGKPFRQTETPVHSYVKDFDLPESIDWRDKNCVTPVKDQGLCGSCWAFSAIGVLESLHCIQTGELVQFSEQQLVDCDDTDDACCGGFPKNALRHVIHNGIMKAKDYEYAAKQSACAYKPDEAIKFNVSKYYILEGEDNMASSVALGGPITVGLGAGGDFHLYNSGIFTGDCPEQPNHAVIIVGYGSEHDKESDETVDYWIVRNSWGKGWGDNGYIKMQRNVNLCGIDTMPASMDLL